MSGPGSPAQLQQQAASASLSSGSSALDPSAGIIPRAVADIFATALAAPEDCTFSIKASYVEIYQERVRDLLAPAASSSNNNLSSPSGTAGAGGLPASENLQIGDDTGPGGRGIYVKGAREEYVSSASELLALMAAGNANRATAATGMNAGSSRSHAIFTITLSSHDATAGISAKSKLILCDLAGSETVSKTGVSGQQLEELKKINKSLSALGLVIHALTEGGGPGGASAPRSHVPYRDSKLTRLLQECLGGNARTALLCAASPSAWNAAETLSTLRFGARAKKVRNAATAHRERSPAETAKHAAACEGALTRFDAAAALALAVLEASVLSMAPDAAASSMSGSSPLEAIAALLLSRREGAAVLSASTDIRLATAAAALSVSNGAGPPLSEDANKAAFDSLAGADSTDLVGSLREPASAYDDSSTIKSTSADISSAAKKSYNSGNASSLQAASGSDSDLSELEQLRQSNASLKAEVASLTSQVNDMVELLTEAGGEIAMLQSAVMDAAAAAASDVPAPAAASGLTAPSAPSSLVYASDGAHRAVSPSAAGTSAEGGDGNIPAASSDVRTQQLEAELSSSHSELTLLRGELAHAEAEASDMRSELIEAKARVAELEDALAAAPVDASSVATKPAAFPGSNVGAPQQQDEALSRLSTELASRNQLISAYEGRLTTLMQRMAAAAETGDMRLLEGGFGRDGFPGSAVADDGDNAPPVKSIRGRGGHGAAPRLGGSPQLNRRGRAGSHASSPGDGSSSGADAANSGGLLSRLWRRISNISGLQQHEHQPTSPGLHALSRALLVPPPTQRDVSFTTSADLHIISPATAMVNRQQQRQQMQMRALMSPAGSSMSSSSSGTTAVAGGSSVGASFSSESSSSSGDSLTSLASQSVTSVSAASGPELLAKLIKACEEGDIAAVRATLTSPAGPGVACLPDSTGKTAILYACRSGHLQIASALVEACGTALLHGAADKEGRNALHYAARRGHNDVVQWLILQGGCEVSTPDNHGLTPLHHAVLGKSHVVAQALLAAGADPLATDANGASPLDLALKQSSSSSQRGEDHSFRGLGPGQRLLVALRY